MLSQTLQLSTAELLGRVETFLSSLKHRRPETRGTYQRALRQFVVWFRKDGQFRFRVDDIERYKRYLTKHRKLSAVSVSTYLTAVRRFCQNLVDTDLLESNPAKEVSGNKRPISHSRRPLTYAETTHLLEQIDASEERGVRDQAMIKLILGCGLSAIEIVRANVGDIVESGDKHVLLIQGKGHDTKDAQATLPEEAYSAVTAYLNTRTQPRASEPLFLSAGNRYHGKRMTTRGINQRINHYLSGAGIKQSASRRVTPYSLRHTAALMMVDAGASAEEIRERFRLGSIRTAMIYVNQKGTLRKN